MDRTYSQGHVSPFTRVPNSHLLLLLTETWATRPLGGAPPTPIFIPPCHRPKRTRHALIPPYRHPRKGHRAVVNTIAFRERIPPTENSLE